MKKDVLTKILDNPWSTTFIIGALASAIVRIVNAVKSAPPTK